MVFHRTGAVENGQWTVGFRLKGIVRATMVQVMAETGDEQTEDFQVVHKPFHLPRFHHCKHCLGHVESMAPVVILHRPIVLLDAQYPAAKDLRKGDFINHFIIFSLFNLHRKEHETVAPNYTAGTFEWLLGKCRRR